MKLLENMSIYSQKLDFVLGIKGLSLEVNK